MDSILQNRPRLVSTRHTNILGVCDQIWRTNLGDTGAGEGTQSEERLLVYIGFLMLGREHLRDALGFERDTEAQKAFEMYRCPPCNMLQSL